MVKHVSNSPLDLEDHGVTKPVDVDCALGTSHLAPPSPESPSAPPGSPGAPPRDTSVTQPGSPVVTGPSLREVGLLTPPPSPGTEGAPPVTSAANGAAHIVAYWHTRGVTFYIKGNRLKMRPPGAYPQRTAEERAAIDLHREELKEMVRAGLTEPPSAPGQPLAQPRPPAASPSPPSQHEAEPMVWTTDYARRITDADVLAALGVNHGLSK